MDLFGRLKQLIEDVGPISVTIGALGLVVMLLLAVSNKRALLLTVYLFALMLSGCVVQSIDAAGTLARWCMIFLLAGTCIHGTSWPGFGAVMFGAFAVASALYIPRAPAPLYGLQFSFLLFVASIPMSMALSHYINSLQRLQYVLRLILVTAGFYALIGFATLSTLRSGTRFSGMSSSAPLFVITGGLLLPVALWAAFNERSKRWRLYSMVLGAMIAMLCLISGQRTGTYAGFIACTPLLARLGVRRLFAGFLLAAAAGALMFVVISFNPEQAGFITSRFGDLDLTGRESRWARAIELCLKSPIIGHGPGANFHTGFGFHNAYLMAWYDGGLLGLLLFTGAYFVIAAQAFKQGFLSRSSQSQEIARLVLGQIMGLAAAGVFEGKTLSPSNIAMFFALFGSIVVARLKSIERMHPIETFPEHAMLPAQLHPNWDQQIQHGD